LWQKASVEGDRARRALSALVAAQVEALVSDGRVAEYSEDWDKAESIYRKALSLDPHDPVVLGNLARVLQEQYLRTPQPDLAQLDEALGYCEEAFAAQPATPRLANVYGVLLSMAGKYDAARSVFRKELVSTPGAPWTWLNLAAVEFLEGNFQTAQENLLKSVAVPFEGKPYCHGWRELATLQHYLGDARCSETIDKAIECGYGMHPFFHLVRARIRLTSPSQTDSARSLADAEMADGFASSRNPYTKRYLALALLRQNQSAKALNAAARAYQLGDLPVFPKLLVAMAEAKLGNAQRARNALDEADATWPPDLRERGQSRRSRHMGMLWFESADELLALRAEAVNLIERQ
jgi:tetratricopeptide (TPR) repeat protein